MNKKQAKRRRDIKTKLMAAICMLLVSSIMMVSTTYAWFTLSTAPEVTGINTAVGANGNLEMALQPLNGNSTLITSSVGDSTQPAAVKNTTWGNLVDVGDNDTYGLNNIMLYPAKLATEETANGVAIKQNPLYTPTYGADGRLGQLENKTITGVYNPDGKFMESYTGTVNNVTQTINNAVGVRAIGVSSGMSDRQLAFRATLSAANTAATKAKSVAAQSLNANGAALADIAVKHATRESDGETYSVAELQSLQKILNALVGTDANAVDGALEYIQDALIQYVKVVALNNATDDGYAAVQTAFEDATLDNLATLMETYKVNLTGYTGETGYIATLKNTISKVTTAKNGIDGLLASGETSFEWDDFDEYLTQLANPNAMQINGIAVSDLNKNWLFSQANGDVLPTDYTIGEDGYVYDEEGAIVSNMARLVDAVLNDGLMLIIRSGAGVYADVADFCGDYSAAVTLSKISYGGMTVKNLDATMTTRTTQTTPYLVVLQNAMPNFNAGAGQAASAAINDFYGYIIDLAFRTNAAGSKLQLQGEAVDRIYNDGTNEATMGHGATMAFKATDSTSFTAQQVKNLMGCIRVVFFNTDNKVIVGYARLDATTAVTGEDGTITMTLVMTNANGEVLESQDIMDLEQNVVHELSVMVYLDGETITNADVAIGASSMTGTMNLQFSSSANLTPMDYTALKEGTGETPTTPTIKELTATVTGLDGATATAAFGSYAGKTGVLAVITNAGSAVTTGTVTINGVDATYNSVAGGWFAEIATEPASAAIAYTAPTT
jgi:hypothetical protein